MNAHRAPRRLCWPVLLLLTTATTLCAGLGNAQTVDTKLWVTDGPVRATALSGSTLYIAGDFTRVGPAAGGGIPLSSATAAPVKGFPKVAGFVTLVVSDGAGGWFVAGEFARVGTAARSNLAHILADGSVSDWDPRPVGNVLDPNPAGHVVALAVSGGIVYAAGRFTSIGGQARSDIAALDATTGLATPWNPNPDGRGVGSLAVSGGTVYVGGMFDSIGGQARKNLAAINATTGLATAWAPNASDLVKSIVVSRGTVYVQGDFSTIGGQWRSQVAALDVSTGFATAFDPGITDGLVHALAVSGDTVYVGGQLHNIGGKLRRNIAALDATTGLATEWNPGADDNIVALAVNGGTVYAGGDFSTIGGQAHSYVAAFDVTTGLATAWDPKLNRPVRALAVSGGMVYVGGSEFIIGGKTRRRLAALDLTTGRATGWDPRPNGLVDALVVSGATLYVAGQFDSVGGQARRSIAAFDVNTGAATMWNPSPQSGSPSTETAAVYALAVSGGLVYVGGYFTTIGGQARNGIAALDSRTGLATTWDPHAPWLDPETSPSVNVLAESGGTVYAAGQFTSIGGQVRNGVAALDATTGLATPFEPNTNGIVHALAVSGGTVYAGGYFTSIGGQSRNSLAALDATTGLATAWDASATFGGNLYGNGVELLALVAIGGSLYVGGTFSIIGGQARYGLAALDATTGLAAPWNPSALGSIDALTVSGGTLYAGGRFLSIGGQPQSNIAAISASPGGTAEVTVRLEIAPHRLNLRSHDRWVAAFITVPEPYRAADIDLSTLRLNGSVPVATRIAPRIHDRRVMALFSREALIATLEPGRHVPVTISGLIAGRTFQGTDFISVESHHMDLEAPSRPLAAGARMEVHWEVPADAPDTEVSLLLSTDDGASWSVQVASLPNTGSYSWVVPQISSANARLAVVKRSAGDEDGPVTAAEYTESSAFAIGSPTAVEVPLPELAIRMPNPIAGPMGISFELATEAPAQLRIYDIGGRLIHAQEVGGQRGPQSIQLGRTLPGIYVVQLAQAGRALVRRVAVIR